MQQEIDKLIFAFSDKLAKDLNESLNKALKDGGSNNPMEAASRCAVINELRQQLDCEKDLLCAVLVAWPHGARAHRGACCAAHNC